MTDKEVKQSFATIRAELYKLERWASGNMAGDKPVPGPSPKPKPFDEPHEPPHPSPHESPKPSPHGPPP